MNGKHCAPRTYTHIEKIRIMNDVIVCFMYYQEFMLPEVKACREREAKRRAERLMRQAERDVRKEWALYDK